VAERRTWLGIAIGVTIALLVMTNVLLWQLLDKDTETKTVAVKTPAGLLPPASTGTSNKATIAELDRLSRDLNVQFRLLRSDLRSLPNALAAVADLPASFAPFANSLETLAGQGGKIGEGARALQQIAAVADRLGGNTSDRLATLQRRLGQIRTNIAAVEGNTSSLTQSSAEASQKLSTTNGGIATTNSQLGDVTSKLTTSNNGIGTTNERLQGVADTLTSMNGTMTDLNQTMARVDTNSTATAADTKTMASNLGLLRNDFATLNQRMSTLIIIFCQTADDPKPSACAGF
jgi:chromosome segregation ATPase